MRPCLELQAERALLLHLGLLELDVGVIADELGLSLYFVTLTLGHVVLMYYRKGCGEVSVVYL